MSVDPEFGDCKRLECGGIKSKRWKRQIMERRESEREVPHMLDKVQVDSLPIRSVYCAGFNYITL